MLWVSEHGRIKRGDSNRNLESGDLQLCSADFKDLLSLLDITDADAPDYEPIVKYAQPGGKPQLTVQNYVGVIRTRRGVQVEILPKLSKRSDEDAQTSRRLLIKMLLELEDSPFREGTAAELEVYEMPLFEFLMRLFVNQVITIVRKGIARAYVPRKDNLIYLRGKLQLAEHIRRNSSGSIRTYCEYDEYEANRPINRLIKAALGIVSRESLESATQQLCRELLYSFDEVPESKNHRLDYQRMQKDRLIQHYMPAMPACMMILEHLNPLTREGDRQTVSMLFPMEKVFEDYVAAKLPQQLRQWRIRTQTTGQALVEKHLGRKIFNLRPDLELSRGGKRIIADTKWKLINQRDRGNRYGISQGDIYQLFAYSRKYLADQGLREVYLIYPLSETFSTPLKPFWYEENKDVLHVVPFDIESEKLVLPEQSSLRAEEVRSVGIQ